MSQNPVSAFSIDTVLNFDTSIDIVSNAKVKVNLYCVFELLLEIAPV